MARLIGLACLGATLLAGWSGSAAQNVPGQNPKQPANNNQPTQATPQDYAVLQYLRGATGKLTEFDPDSKEMTLLVEYQYPVPVPPNPKANPKANPAAFRPPPAPNFGALNNLQNQLQNV